MKLNHPHITEHRPDIEFDPAARIIVSNQPLVTKGPVEMEIPATTYQWFLAPADLENALRAYIHQTLKYLPSKHFVKVQPVIHTEGTFEGIEFTIVVPERT